MLLLYTYNVFVMLFMHSNGATYHWNYVAIIAKNRNITIIIINDLMWACYYYEPL